MKNFNFSINQKVCFEPGAIKSVPEILKANKVKKVLIVSVDDLKKLGFVDKVAKYITDAKIKVEVFTNVQPNPTVQNVNDGYKVYKKFQPDAIIGLGGGSPMDVAKGIAVLAKFGGKITDYNGSELVPGRIDLLIAIPTTAGTGSESTPSAVITDSKTHYKFSVFSHTIIPHYAILDPELITTIPAGVAASCGVDALIHAMESYISIKSNPYTEAMALKAMEMIGRNIKKYVANREDIEAASNMLIGSNFAGLAFSDSRLGDVHAMSHPVSGHYGVAHGVANAILLPTILAYNALADDGKYLTMYNTIFDKHVTAEEFDPRDLVDAIADLNYQLGIPSCLSEVGVKKEKIAVMSKDAMTSGNIAANPRKTTEKDVIKLYNEAL